MEQINNQQNGKKLRGVDKNPQKGKSLRGVASQSEIGRTQRPERLGSSPVERERFSTGKAKATAPSTAPEKRRRRQNKKMLRLPKKASGDEVLGVLLDQKNGNVFYVLLIDNFRYNGIDYAVMYNYQAGKMSGGKPEILIMRTYHDAKKQYFTSIRDKAELNTIFEVFYRRFEQSSLS